jgi:hypothetical protein
VTSNYTAGDWHGHPNYECDLCSYSTLDETVMEYHQATAHIVFPKSGPPVSEWPAVLTSGAEPTEVIKAPAPITPQEEPK